MSSDPEDAGMDISEADVPLNYHDAPARHSPSPSAMSLSMSTNDQLLEEEILSRHPGYRIQSTLLSSRRRSSEGPLFDTARRVSEAPTDDRPAASGEESDGDQERISRRQRRQRFEKRLNNADEGQKRAPYVVDLRALEYISEVDPNLVCPICQCPFQNPVQLECDHSFCKDCLRQSFNINAERQRSRPCPTCRRPHSVVVERQAPRYVQRMLDELMVKCPNDEAGCKTQLKRGEVRDHIHHYCDHQKTPCPDDDCSHDVLRKDRNKGCLHHMVQCENCFDEIMASDMDIHLEQTCPKNIADCPHCRDVVSKKDLAHHINNICDEAPSVCSGSQYGCTRSGKRSEVMSHANHCPIATMAPFLEKQRVVQEEQRAAIEKLQRRNEIFEGSVRAMQTLIYDTPAGASLGGAAAVPSQPPTFDATLPSEAPFDTPTQHLLSLHESLRDEFSRLEAALSDVDARNTMMIVNESQRNKEDMAHTNAAINSMRTQLHWLMSAQVQAVQRARTGSGPGGGAGPAAGPSSATMSGGVGAGFGPIRRPSGSETKL